MSGVWWAVTFVVLYALCLVVLSVPLRWISFSLFHRHRWGPWSAPYAKCDRGSAPVVQHRTCQVESCGITKQRFI